jgi:hypothetical protein
MWTTLQDPQLIKFYEEFHRGRYHPGEDWQPMVRAVQYLQNRDYAASLFAFTSLAHLVITTAPSYFQCEHHYFVIVVWMFQERQFRIAYDTRGWISDRSPDRICEEPQFPSAVDSLVQRLLLESPESNEL